MTAAGRLTTAPPSRAAAGSARVCGPAGLEPRPGDHRRAPRSEPIRAVGAAPTPGPCRANERNAMRVRSIVLVATAAATLTAGFAPAALAGDRGHPHRPDAAVTTWSASDDKAGGSMSD